MRRIGIIGVGLIGGSLGLVWRNRLDDVEVIGFDDPSVLDRAIERGAIDRGAASLKHAVVDADVVVLATPIRTIVGLLEDIAPHLKHGAVVSDVGSVKQPITERAHAVLPSHSTFVGGHPMAGSERRGIDYADTLLFENATYVLCPPDEATAEAFESSHNAFLDLVRVTGARIILLDPKRHDRIAAVVSHLPQLLAVMLMNQARQENETDEACLKLAAGGFRDLTRIASSPFDVWRDILLANNGPILDVLSAFATRLQSVRHRMAANEIESIASMFEIARSARESIPRDTKGFLHPLSDVYVYAEDRPGELLSITRILHEANLNIKDIELLKIREGTGGAFRIGFSDEYTADAAATSLTEEGYTAYRL
ncbi:MAG: prephenate dehydrogenase/arogenate dehydrogenase family protein [Rhodothermales bacterium]